MSDYDNTHRGSFEGLREVDDLARNNPTPVIHAGDAARLFCALDELAREVERLAIEGQALHAILSTVGEALGSGVEESPVDAARRLRDERDSLRGRLAVALAREACEHRHPEASAVKAAARRIAAHQGWPDPFPEADV